MTKKDLTDMYEMDSIDPNDLNNYDINEVKMAFS